MMRSVRRLTASAEGVEADDIERSLSAGAHRARHALKTGVIAEIFEQTWLDRRKSESKPQLIGHPFVFGSP
jgi:hypothetical protein